MSARKDGAALATLSLPGISRAVGRPRKPGAMTGAQRVALHRARKKAAGISVTCNENSGGEK